MALIGDIKQMDTRFIRAAIFQQYGVTMFVGVGIPIPILDEDMVEKTAVRNKDIFTDVFDYSVSSGPRPALKKVSYEELMSGSILLNRKTVPTAPLSSIRKAREIAELLKQSIINKEFVMTEPVASLPKTNIVNKLEIRENGNEED